MNRSSKKGKRGGEGPSRRGKENHEVTYELWFHPASANVTLGGSASYSAGLGEFIGPGASAVDASAAITTSLNDLTNQAEYQALYDSYRINKVEYHWVPYGDCQPNADKLTTAQAMSVKPQMLLSIIDLDDSTAPATIGELLEYETFRFARPSDVHVVRYVPKVAREIFDGVTASYEEPEGPVFIDCAQPTTPHYGHKVWVSTHGASANIQNIWRIFGKMSVTFKRAR